jgi:hypothetical protein
MFDPYILRQAGTGYENRYHLVGTADFPLIREEGKVFTVEVGLMKPFNIQNRAAACEVSRGEAATAP